MLAAKADVVEPRADQQKALKAEKEENQKKDGGEQQVLPTLKARACRSD